MVPSLTALPKIPYLTGSTLLRRDAVSLTSVKVANGVRMETVKAGLPGADAA
jgi:hypothetical protein